jgi:hypothetical protein
MWKPKPFEFDPELLEKARWIVERGLDKPREHEIDRRLPLYVPLPVPVPPAEKKEESFNVW